MTSRASVLIISLLFSLVASATPQIERWSTASGAQVLYVHTPEIPMVDIRVIFDAGSARDGKKGGIAAMTNGLLSTGTGIRGETKNKQIANKKQKIKHLKTLET